eukprot:c26067_g1_i1 orf=345-2204(-)
MEDPVKEAEVLLLSEHEKDEQDSAVDDCGFHDAEIECRGFSVDDILKLYVGEFGWGQLIHFVLTSMAWVTVALQAFVTVFAEKSPKWRCSEPGLFGLTKVLAGEDVPYLNTGVTSDICTPESSMCSLDHRVWEWIGQKSQSTISQWELICHNDYKVGLVQSVYFLGTFIGAGLFGNLSDSFLGRKGALALACGLSAVSSFLIAFAPSYWVYLVLRVASGVSSGGIGASSFVLATELLGPSKRGPVGMTTFYFFSLGIVMLVGIAYKSTSWRYLYLGNTLVSVLYCLFILPFIRESPRWYLVRGRPEDTLKLLRLLAIRNGKCIPPGVTVSMERRYKRNSSSIMNCQADLSTKLENSTPITSHTSGKASGTLVDVFSAPDTRKRIILIVFLWLACGLVYYGINLNVRNLGTNLYLSVLLNGLAEIPGLAIAASLLGRFGRRTILIFTMLVSGISCLVGAYVTQYQGNTLQPSTLHIANLPNDRQIWELPAANDRQWAVNYVQSNLVDNSTSDILLSAAKLVMGMLGLFCTSAGYNVLYIYTAEIFPTVVRSAAIGLGSQAAQTGSLIAPMVVLLGQKHSSFPFAAMGVVCLAGGLIACMLRDTSNRPLYETLEGMQEGEA